MNSKSKDAMPHGRTSKSLLALIALLAVAAPAAAHPAGPAGPGGGTGSALHDLAAGATHPFTGADHLLAMLAVGLLAARLGGRARWALPLLFVAGMAAGGAAAAAGAVPVGAAEQVIAASVVVFGLLLVALRRLPVLVAFAAVPAFAFFHGYAHLAEGAGHGPLAYGAGMLAASTLLLLAGVGLGRGLDRLPLPGRTAAPGAADAVWRTAGAAIACAGVGLFVGTW